jgi:hypothetical protein
VYGVIIGRVSGIRVIVFCIGKGGLRLTVSTDWGSGIFEISKQVVVDRRGVLPNEILGRRVVL